jgi:hypothetical protein
MSTTETTARLAVDPSLTSVLVAYYLSDGTTARARYPWDGKSDAVEAVETLIREKKRSGSGLAVDSLDSEQDANAERFIAPSHIVAWVSQLPGSSNPRGHVSIRARR